MQIFIIIASVIGGLIFLVLLAFVIKFAGLWIQSISTKAGIGLLDLMGMHFRAASPDGYRLPDTEVGLAQEEAQARGGSVTVVSDPREAAAEADAVYTDIWTSMGQEAESQARRAAFQGYTVTTELLQHARSHAIVLHCLPAHRGEEITNEVMEGKHSLVFEQAENRLHVQKAILIYLSEATKKSAEDFSE